MKFIYSIVILFITNQSFSQLTVADKVVAQIGENIILESDIQNQIQQAKKTGEAVDENTRCLILEELLFQNLLLHQAKLDSIIIPEAQVDSEMESRLRQIEQQIGSRQKLEEFYGKSTTELKLEFKDAIKDRLLAQEMERKITENLSVTPKEVSQFFGTIPADSIPFINSQLSFQQIVHFPTITKEDKKLAYDQLSEIRANIVAGKSFETQARINSEDPGSAKDGGKISATRGMMVPSFENALFNLKPGEISPVFESPYGYHIVTLIERKGDDYTCRHILIMAKFNNQSLNVSAQKMDSCYAALLAGKMTWDEAVVRYSNDEATKQNRGIITNPITSEQTWDMEDLNQVDQQIFVLTDVLEKGGISTPNLYADIYDQKQGIRIVRLMDRTAPHKANLKDDYGLIKRAAENDKKSKMIRNWVKNQIADSFIRIDPSYKGCAFKNVWIQ